MNAEERLSVATNAAAGAMFGVGVGRIDLDDVQTEAARTIARRVLEHVDRYDLEHAPPAVVTTLEERGSTFWERYAAPDPDDVSDVNIGNFPYGIGVTGADDGRVGPVLRPIMGPLERDEALVVSAWFATLADPLGKRFPGILERIANS